MRTSLGILPFLGTILWTVTFYCIAPSFRISPSRSWREASALACVLLGTFSLIATESLSALHLLSLVPMLLTWGRFSSIPLIFVIRHRREIHPEREIIRLRLKIAALPLWASLVLTGTAILIFIMGVATPPMNFDVQIYHLPRQIYWMMQGSVEPFLTSHTHQISMPVLSEFMGLNLMILSGGDAWHNLVQMLFLIAASGLVTLLARSLGSSPRGQILALLFVVLVPVIFFEASNAKNDIILTFFILLPLFIASRIWTQECRASVSLLLLAALSAGLALATKGTAIAYLIAPALLLVMACIHQGALRPLLFALLPALLLALLPAAPQLMRNMREFHSPAGPNLHHFNLSHDPASLASIAIRNAAGQFTCGSDAWNLILEQKIRSALALMNIDADDSATTFDGQKFHLPYFAGLEDIAPAPIQTALLLLLPLGFLFPSFRKSRALLPLFTTTTLSLFFFCFIFRWQPWQGRLLMPLYFMAAPMAGIFLDLLRPLWLPLVFTLLELLTLKPHLIFTGERPLLGGSSIFRLSKEDQMSRMMPGRSEEIRKLIVYLKQREIHTLLVDGGATEIYGLLRAVHRTLPLVIIQSGYADHPSSTDAIIATTTRDAGVPPPPIDPNPLAPTGFKPSWIGSYYRVFLPTQ